MLLCLLFSGSKRRDREKINSHLVQPGVLKMAARGMMPFLVDIYSVIVNVGVSYI